MDFAIVLLAKYHIAAPQKKEFLLENSGKWLLDVYFFFWLGLLSIYIYIYKLSLSLAGLRNFAALGSQPFARRRPWGGFHQGSGDWDGPKSVVFSEDSWPFCDMFLVLQRLQVPMAWNCGLSLGMKSLERLQGRWSRFVPSSCTKVCGPARPANREVWWATGRWFKRTVFIILPLVKVR